MYVYIYIYIYYITILSLSRYMYPCIVSMYVSALPPKCEYMCVMTYMYPDVCASVHEYFMAYIRTNVYLHAYKRFYGFVNM